MKKKVIRAAIGSLKRERRTHAVGFHSYLNGYRDGWTKRAHKKYQDLTEAIEALEKELE